MHHWAPVCILSSNYACMPVFRISYQETAARVAAHRKGRVSVPPIYQQYCYCRAVVKRNVQVVLYNLPMFTLDNLNFFFYIYV